VDVRNRWWAQPWFLVELFAIANLGFLTLDIYLAHSVNEFRRQAEYIPLYFSGAAPVVLLLALVIRRRWLAVWKDVGFFVGWLAILVGLAGVIFHLDSSFFYERTLRSLTYSAPFAAPLAYTGLGFLLLVNRMVDSNTIEWVQWILFLTLGGFVGNLVFSLSDHAENGFFNGLEWVPVIASAVAIGFLSSALVARQSQPFLGLCGVVLLLEAAVGVWGFVLHAERNLAGPSVHIFNNLIYGAPPMAPLLFPNLAALGLIALWHLGGFSF
jgi:hypothetical protein